MVGPVVAMATGWAAVERFSNTPLGSYNTYFDWATVSVSVIAQLADPSNPNINVLLYAWLEDVELKSPGVTNFTLAPQGVTIAQPVSVTPMPSESPASRLPTPTESGFQKFLDGTHKAVRTIGGIVIDSAILVGHAAVLAACVGLSDPAMQDNTTIVATIPHFDAPHMYGKSPALMMSANQQCRTVQPYGAFSLKKDAMDIATYCSRMGLLTTKPWASTNLPGDELFQILVNPGLISVFNGQAGYTPLSYAASMFRLWRGSIRYRFALSKTRFHAGVLEIVWQMGSNVANLSDDAHAAICYRAVWDIQESESMEIEIPYCCPLPWQNVTSKRAQSTAGSSYVLLTGKLRIRVVNPLITPNGLAAETIQIVTYVAGGKDIEFSVPSAPGVTLIPPIPNLAPVAGKGKEKARFYAEGGGIAPGVFQADETKGLESANPPLVMAPVAPYSDHGLIACIGEEIKNFRLLTRRFSKYHLASSIVTKVFTLNDLRVIVADQARHPFFTMLMCTYVFLTGGFRVAAVLTSGSCLVASNWCGFNLLGLANVFVPAGSPERVFGIPWHSTVPFGYVRSLGSDTTSPNSLYMEATSGTTSLMWSAATAFIVTGKQIGRAHV